MCHRAFFALLHEICRIQAFFHAIPTNLPLPGRTSQRTAMHFCVVCSILVRPWRQYSTINKHMSTIPNLTESQIWTVTSSLKERFKGEVEVQEIDSDMRLRLHDHELWTSPQPVLATGQWQFRDFQNRQESLPRPGRPRSQTTGRGGQGVNPPDNEFLSQFSN